MGDILLGFFDDNEFGDTTNLVRDDILRILESLDDVEEFPVTIQAFNGGGTSAQTPSSSNVLLYLSETEFENSPKPKRLKTTKEEANHLDGQQRISHITVERNRRKQMNEHLSVLRSLMPCFYVKRGDQASIIGGVIDYINELQQVLQALEAKKQRKVYSEILSPRLVSPSPLSPRKAALSPRITLPISPRTPQPTSPYNPKLGKPFLSQSMATGNSVEPSPSSSSSTSTSGAENLNELVANCKSSAAEVEVKFSAPNVLLKTISPKIPGQAMKIISALENLSLEILQVNVNTVDGTMVNSFTIKIGIECQLSAEDLAHKIQQTFCQ